jgi:cell division protein FtsQ
MSGREQRETTATRADAPAPKRPTDKRVDRRIAERRRQVVIDEGRRRRRVLLAGLVVALLAVVLWRVSSSSLFGLTSVEVSGLHHLRRATVVDAAAVRIGAPVLRMDLGAVKARVERLPWVEHAKVSRAAPSGLRIEVTERTAAASLQGRGRYWLVAADGTVLEAAAGRPAGIPFVDGVPVRDYAPGVRLPAQGPLANALAALKGMDPRLRAQITGVLARTEASLAFGLKGGGVLQYGIAERQAAKDEAALLLMRNAQAQGRKVVRIDVRAPRTPVLQAKNDAAVVENVQPRR